MSNTASHWLILWTRCALKKTLSWCPENPSSVLPRETDTYRQKHGKETRKEEERRVKKYIRGWKYLSEVLKERQITNLRMGTMLCCVVDCSPLITEGCPEKGLPAGGICACAKCTWNMPRWITEDPSAPLAAPLHDNPSKRKKRGREWGYLETKPTSFLILPLVTLLLAFIVP